MKGVYLVNTEMERVGQLFDDKMRAEKEAKEAKEKVRVLEGKNAEAEGKVAEAEGKRLEAEGKVEEKEKVILSLREENTTLKNMMETIMEFLKAHTNEEGQAGLFGTGKGQMFPAN